MKGRVLLSKGVSVFIIDSPSAVLTVSGWLLPASSEGLIREQPEYGCGARLAQSEPI